MPKYTVYYLVYGDTEFVLDKDPRGWDDSSIALSRDENFGLNVTDVVNLKFSGKAKTILSTLYKAKYSYASASVVIKQRNNLWQLVEQYRYRIDFSKYQEDRHYCTVSGIEEGLYNKVQKFADTEYEIDAPTDKKFIAYTGVSVYKKNLLQCLYGKISEKSSTS